MHLDGLALLAAFLGVLTAFAWPLGAYIARLATGAPGWLAPAERAILRLAGDRPEREMGWREYAGCVVAFSTLGAVLLYALQRLQGSLPLNPRGLRGVEPGSALNTAASFVTNTNWQGYAGEATMSHLTQAAGLSVQNFLSAATGIAVALALARGFGRAGSEGIGNFWSDLVRATLGLLLPGSMVLALLFVSQGVVQSFDASVVAVPMDAAGRAQDIPLGPVASQEAIKVLGTNGGGFFNANSAHPFENPGPLTNLLQVLAMLLVPAALCFAFGRIAGGVRQGVALFAAMTVLFAAAAVATNAFESQPSPMLAGLPVDQARSGQQSGGNMEGKEVRFGIAQSALFATATTAASCGAVNGMHGSFTPLGGLVPMVLIQTGEVVYGGAGSGLYGMLLMAIVTVFVAGLMVGRTPEYVGKKIEPFEMKMTALAMLSGPLLALAGTAVAVALEPGRAGVLNEGPHGFSEILYAYSSAANNNGSAFAGLSADTPFYNATLAVAMWLGRFAVIVPVLAMAGSLAGKRRLATTEGSLPTTGPLFVVMLGAVVVIVGALTFLPALALGPVAEHLMLHAS